MPMCNPIRDQFGLRGVGLMTSGICAEGCILDKQWIGFGVVGRGVWWIFGTAYRKFGRLSWQSGRNSLCRIYWLTV